MTSHGDALERLMPPVPRFLWGLALMPLAGLSRDWRALLVPAAASIALVLLSGKRVRIVQNILFLASVLFFSLLAPSGRVVAEWGPFAVTQGAFDAGLKRGLGLLVLVWTSAFAVSRHLRLPGRFGAILAQSFSFFNELMGLRKNLSRTSPWASLDAILYSAWAAPEDREPQPPRSPAFLIMGALLAGLSLALWAFCAFVPLPFFS